MIDKGVHERVRLSQLYDRKRDDLERQHEQVRQCLEEERAKVGRRSDQGSFDLGIVCYFNLQIL